MTDVFGAGDLLERSIKPRSLLLFGGLISVITIAKPLDQQLQAR